MQDTFVCKILHVSLFTWILWKNWPDKGAVSQLGSLLIPPVILIIHVFELSGRVLY